MEHQRQKPDGIQNTKPMQAWSVIASMIVFPIVVFLLEYLIIPVSSAVRFYAGASVIFDHTSIGWIYRSSGNPIFTYYAIYIVSIPIVYLSNMAIAIPYFGRSKDVDDPMLDQDSVLKWIGACFSAVAIFSYLWLPPMYQNKSLAVFPPNSFGILTYSFWYFMVCFTTVIPWTVFFLRVKKRLSQSTRK